MPTFRFTARFQGETMLSEDVYENVLYYDVATSEGIFETIADGIIDAFETWGYHGDVNGAEVRVYEVTGGQPLYSKSYPDYVFSTLTGPGEVAICLSYATSSSWETTTARRRGRLFLGPLNSTPVAAPRPASNLIAATLALGQELATVGGEGATWMLWSPTDQVATPIEIISVDDAWDTQRRRGLAPTTRTVETLA